MSDDDKDLRTIELLRVGAPVKYGKMLREVESFLIAHPNFDKKLDDFLEAARGEDARLDRNRCTYKTLLNLVDDYNSDKLESIETHETFPVIPVYEQGNPVRFSRLNQVRSITIVAKYPPSLKE
jgi:hypothetical protein